jgi:ABC-type transport system involved in multi-copper enzyme maturation permease subunit
MTFLPIVRRELSVASRRWGTFWLRSGVALGVIIAAVWVFIISQGESQREIGQVIFYVLTGAALGYCLLAGMRSTADCLSEEKREGTLGLLFLTDLRGYDVVIGKLAANSLNAFYGVLAVMPVLGLPLLMGGVTVGEFGRVAAVLVNTLFFSLCAGMFASAVSRSNRKAIGATFLIVLLFTAGSPALGAWIAWMTDLRDVEPGWYFPSSVFTYVRAMDRQFRAQPDYFHWSLGIIHGMGWAFLGLASFIAPRTWQDRPTGARGLRWSDRWQNWTHGNRGERKAFREHLLNVNAFYWLASRPRQRVAWSWAALVCVAGVWVWGILEFKDEWFNEGIYITTALFLNSMFKCWVASEAARRLTEDRRIGALELLLSTSLTVRDILSGQRLALQRQFLGPILIVLCAEGIMWISGTSSVAANASEWGSLWIAGMTMFIADLITLYWVGMWLGLSARNPKRAFSGAVVRVLVLPWIAYGAFLMFIAAAPPLQGGFGWDEFLGAWFLLGLATDLGFGLHARHKLLTEFRPVAAQRYQPQLSWWKRLFAR